MMRPCRLQDEWLDPAKCFAFPYWEKIHEWVGRTFPTTDHHQVYCELARDWVQRIVAGFAVPMQVSESTHFIVAVPTTGNPRQYLELLEIYRAQIHTSLAGLELFPWVGKSIVLVAPSQEMFVRYLSDYQPPGSYAMPGGVCLRHGYIHFVLAESNLTAAAPVLAHELVHVCVANQPWPLWLEEAVVQAIETKLCGSNHYRLNREIVDEHKRYWTAEKLGLFWRGDSFWAPDEGSRLSYHLARFLLEAAAQQGREGQLAFLRTAHRDDSGFAAMHTAIGVTPEELVHRLLERPRPNQSRKERLAF